jgi:hypothetical protein
MNRFGECSGWKYRALQIYLILIGAAARRQTLTYAEVARLMPPLGPNVISAPLSMLHHWCEHNGLPPINVIVVSTETGRPGRNIPSTSQPFETIREEVFQQDWYSILPPEPEEMHRIYKQARTLS